MDKLWVHITTGFAFLTVMGIFALLAHQWIEVSPWILATVLAGVGLGLILLTRRALAPLSAITHVVEGIANGDIKQRPLTVEGSHETERLRVATNRMVARLNGVCAQARELADGNIGVLEVEKKVLRTQRLSDADQPIKADAGDLERIFVELINQRRRLTIQARMISQDRLTSPLLDQKAPGELGETFGNMVDNLRTIAARAKDITGGDLTTTVEGDGELTTAFNQMVDWLRGLVEQISGTAIHISTAAEQILAVLREQESAANHQASSVEETQRTMETLLASAKKIAENAQHVFKSAEKTQGSNRTVAERISELKNHTERISEILEGIKRIADRSDLLALNASLEGMRAGEAGKGFTLVAAEMRRLAENIKDSVGDIKTLVTDIGESSMATASATDEGTRLSENTTDNALKITLITQQQKSGTEQVTQSMDDLSELINQDVAGTRQVTMAAGELVNLAESLRDLVDAFRVTSLPTNTGPYQALRPRQSRRSSGLRAAPAPSLLDSALLVSPLAEAAQLSNHTDRIELPAPRSPRVTPREQSAVAAPDATKRSEPASTKSSRRTQRLMSSPAVMDTPDSQEETSDASVIPPDSGADQPTVEFSTHLPQDEQHQVMRQMLETARPDARRTVETDLGDLDDFAGLGDADAFDPLDDLEASASALRAEPSTIDDDLDALEREIDKKNGAKPSTEQVEES